MDTLSSNTPQSKHPRGYSHGARWTDAEIEILKTQYPTNSMEQMRTLLPAHPESSIESMAYKFGIRKAEGYRRPHTRLAHAPKSYHPCAYKDCDALITPRSTYCRKHVPMTPERIAKRSAAQRGKRVSEETRAKLRSANLGQTRSPHTEDAKAKISASNKGKHSQRRRRHTEATKLKISQAHKMRLANMTTEEYRDFIATKEKYSYFRMSSTALERAMHDELRRLGIVFEAQKKISRFMVDIYVPSQNLVIEVNGCVVHGCEQCGHNREWQIKRRQRDQERMALIQSKGYTVQVIWEHELRARGIINDAR